MARTSRQSSPPQTQRKGAGIATVHGAADRTGSTAAPIERYDARILRWFAWFDEVAGPAPRWNPTIWASVNRFFIVRPLGWAGL